jgi:hypothetical protein
MWSRPVTSSTMARWGEQRRLIDGVHLSVVEGGEERGAKWACSEEKKN